MKKFAISFCLFFAAYQGFTVELWNGFTSDMSEEDVITRANEILEPSKVLKDKYHDFLVVNVFNVYYYEVPKLYAIKVTSSSSKYRSTEDNIIFSFYNDKLFAISVDWEAKSEDLLNAVINEYGYPSDFYRNELYRWYLPGKDFFLAYGNFCIVDRTTREQWIAEQIRVAQQKKIDDAAREAAKRKAVIDNMHF